MLWGLSLLPLGAFAQPARVLVIIIALLVILMKALPLVGIDVAL